MPPEKKLDTEVKLNRTSQVISGSAIWLRLPRILHLS